jgi:hypothetical protein
MMAVLGGNSATWCLGLELFAKPQLLLPRCYIFLLLHHWLLSQHTKKTLNTDKHVPCVLFQSAHHNANKIEHHVLPPTPIGSTQPAAQHKSQGWFGSAVHYLQQLVECLLKATKVLP